jgi:proline iminopeptidase
MPRATINGADIHYEVSGAGPPLIAVHGGLGFDHSSMVNTLAPFEDLRTIVYYDQRGNGLSERVDLSTITIDQLAADLDALREHLGFEQVGVAGHSYGSFVALQHATTYPDRVSHLLLLGASPGVFEPTADELAERGDRSWVTPEIEAVLPGPHLAFPDSDEEFEAAFPSMAPAYLRHADPSVLSEELSQTIFDAAAMRQGFIALAGWSVVDELSKITAPTLVACGRHDLHTTPECSARLASAIGNAELVWFENSAHFPWLEEREAFDAAVRRWLSKLVL